MSGGLFAIESVAGLEMGYQRAQSAERLFFRLFDVMILIGSGTSATPMRNGDRPQSKKKAIHLQPVEVLQELTLTAITPTHSQTPNANDSKDKKVDDGIIRSHPCF